MPGISSVDWRGFQLVTSPRAEISQAVICAARSGSGFVAMAYDAASFVAAAGSGSLLESLRGEVLGLPDGWPVALLASAVVGARVGTCPGPDLFSELIREDGLTHFIVGGGAGTAQALARAGCRSVCGVHTEFFADPLADSLAALEGQIVAAQPSIVWVCLGSTKQLIIAWRLSKLLPSAVILAVGAALDFSTGDIQRAPLWMRRVRLEWAYRLATEPKRLWRRYFLTAPTIFGWWAQEKWKSLNSQKSAAA